MNSHYPDGVTAPVAGVVAVGGIGGAVVVGGDDDEDEDDDVGKTQEPVPE